MAYFHYGVSDVEREIFNRGVQLDSAGQMLEADFLGILSKKYKKLESRIGSLTDKHEGTDFVLNDVRIDTTLQFSNKDFMPFIYETKIPATPYENFTMGIRIGNSHNGYTEFPKPVVVIGLDMTPHEYKVWENVIEDNLTRYADDIIITITDVYLTYTLQEEEDRDGLAIPCLISNKNYEQPKTIGSQFAQLNDLQYALQQLQEDIEKNQKGEIL